jgi:hypothetical protein
MKLFTLNAYQSSFKYAATNAAWQSKIKRVVAIVQLSIQL